MSHGDTNRLIAHLNDLYQEEDLQDIEGQSVRHAIDFLQTRGSSLSKPEYEKLQEVLEHLDNDTLRRYNVR